MSKIRKRPKTKVFIYEVNNVGKVENIVNWIKLV